MKTNEIVLTITMLSVSVFCFATGLTYQGWFWTAFLIFFGVVEWLLHKYTGKTLSQWVWQKPFWVRLVLSILMVLAFMSLGWHFVYGSTLEDVQEYSVKQGVGCECLREICPEEEPCYCWYVCEDGSRFRVERSEG